MKLFVLLAELLRSMTPEEKARIRRTRRLIKRARVERLGRHADDTAPSPYIRRVSEES